MINSVAIIGCGNMGGSVAAGLAAGSTIDADDIIVSNPRLPKLDRLKQRFPQIKTTLSNEEAIKCADLVIVAVKPWIAPTVLAQIKETLDYERQIVGSMVGGMDLDEIAAQLRRDDGSLPPLAYIIPNTAASIGQSMTFMATLGCDRATDERLVEIFNGLGKTMLVEPRAMHAGMAVASCGIAFAMRYIRASMEGGVQLGLRPHEALEAVAQTVRGAAMLLQQEGGHPEPEIDKVTTAGGITIRGLNAMEEAGFTASVIRGLNATRGK